MIIYALTLRATRRTATLLTPVRPARTNDLCVSASALPNQWRI